MNIIAINLQLIKPLISTHTHIHNVKRLCISSSWFALHECVTLGTDSALQHFHDKCHSNQYIFITVNIYVYTTVFTAIYQPHLCLDGSPKQSLRNILPNPTNSVNQLKTFHFYFKTDTQ